jgi:hypothetical protein
MTKTEQIIADALAHKPPRQIAKERGLNVYTIYRALRIARQRGIDVPRFAGGRRGTTDDIGQEIRFLIDPDVHARLVAEAAARGTSPRTLVRRIMAALVEDDLFAAVLDDGSAA